MSTASRPASRAGTRAARTDSRGRRPRSRERSQPLEQRILLTATLCLLAFGAVMVYSASSSRSLLEGQGNGSGDLIKFVIYGAIGLVVMHLLARDGLGLARRLTAPLLALSCLLVLAVHIPHVGVQVNGAKRWIGPSMLQFQPSELLKIALVLYAAELIARRPKRVGSLRELYNPLLIVTGVACLLVASQPDLGTAMVIAFTISALLIAAGMPLGTFAKLAGGALTLLILYALVQPYSRARLTSFIDPWSHASRSGYQAVQGQIAIGSGGLFGVGPGQSVQKAFYLPAAHTDFILAVIGEELGAFGICALLFLYGLIAYAGLRAAKAARNLYSALVAVGVTSLILSQAILNVFAVLGLAPLTGVPLPFVSYGSSSLLVMLAAMGLLLNIASGRDVHLRALRSPGPARAAGRASRAGDISPAKPRRSSDAFKEDRDRRRRDAGHVVPALAVAGALRDEGAEVQFIGGERAEAALVPEAGFQLHRIAVEGLSRTDPLRAARALARSGAGALAARRILASLDPDAVLGGGGYISGPVGLAALSMRTPLVLSEADSHLGLANRLLAPWARRVCLAFPIAGREGPRYLVTGRPVPAVDRDRRAAREALGIAHEERCLLVFGGSLGARSINLAALDAFSGAGYRVLHIAGRRDYPELSARALPANHDLREYMDTQEFSRALAAADLALARAGGSVFEIAAHGLPAILVPYPHASADHQSANARWMAHAGAAIVIEDAELDPERLRETVEELFSDPGRLRQMADAALALARPEAASLIAAELLKAAGP